MTIRKLSSSDLENIKSLVEGVVEEKLEAKLEEKLEAKLEEKFSEKLKYLPTKAEFYERTDKILKELEDIRQEITVGSHQYTDHEDRITSLEDIHPEGKHPLIK